MNWNVKILPVCTSYTDEAIVVEAYSYVLEMRARYNETNGQRGAFIVATNSSFGINRGNPNNYPIWCSMYDALGSVGILNCAATVNENWDIDQIGDVPTSCSSNFLISVTNTTSADVKYTDAGYGVNTIDIGAPGEGIYSTLPNNTYGNDAGTSMATPQVAGVIALMYASMSQDMIQAYKKDPANIALSVKQHLLDGADRIPSLNGLVASGRLNAYAAVEAVTCTTTNFMNQVVTTNQTITGCDINVQNVTVQNGVKLTLDATNETIISGPFEVKLGSTLEIK